MKSITTLLAAFSILAAVPCHAAEKKDAKKEDKTKKDDKNKKDDKEQKDLLYTVTVGTTTGEPKETDMSEVKALLSTATAFKFKDIKLDNKELISTVSITKEKGRLSKSDVSRVLKDKPEYKVDKVDEVKPEKEKKEKKDDKKDEKK